MAVSESISPQKPDRWQDFKTRLTNAGPAIVVFVLVLAAWEILVQALDIQQFLLPAPHVIVNALIANSDQLAISVRMAVFEAACGLLLGTILAVTAALLAARWKVVGRALIPFAIGLNAVPTLVFAPIMNNWFGSINPLSKMMIVVTLVYYPIMINVLRGLTKVDQSKLELLRSYGATERDIFLKLRVPNTLPYFFNALKISATLSVIGTVVAGYFGGARAALGVWILNQVVLFKFPPAWAGILAACAIGVSFYILVSLIERVVLRWDPSRRVEER